MKRIKAYDFKAKSTGDRVTKFIGLKLMEIGGLILFILSLKYIGKAFKYIFKGIISLGKKIASVLPEPYSPLENPEYFCLGALGILISIFLLFLIYLWIEWNWEMAGK